MIQIAIVKDEEIYVKLLTIHKFTNSSQKISTHLLTVLTIRVILQLEQRKRDKEIRRLKKISQISLIPTGFRTKTYFNIDY